ncbi:MAG TPA: hypothetical protein VMT58_06520, partial [Candidatus Binataceae bacterium]|nr:hypothetical protein [Candidatus Binataceae bacterium]
MTDRYASLGLDTAWRRFTEERGGPAVALERRMRALEAAVSGEFGLAAENVHLAAELAGLETAIGDDDR